MGVKNNSIVIKESKLHFKNFIKEHLNEIFKDLENKIFIDEYKKQIKIIFLDKISKINNIKHYCEI